MQTRTFTKQLLFTLMLAVFLDIGNFFMPVPIYSPLFLHSSFLHAYSYETRAIMLGVLVACYGFAQLFGGPIFAEISDQHGRKKAILLSMSVAVLGCILGGISITTHTLSLIYVSRILIGFGSGTIAVVFAATADNSTNENRAKNLGYINTGLSIGVAVGPIIGGGLVFTHMGWLGYAIPFYVMAALYILNMLLISKLLPTDEAQRKDGKKIHLFTAFQNLYIIITRSPLLCTLVWMGLLFQLGIESFYLAAPVIGVQKFQMTPATIGTYFFIFGVVAAISSSFLNHAISKYFRSNWIYLVCVFLLIFTLIPLITASTHVAFAIPFVGVGIFGVLSWVHINNLFSESVDEKEQGLVFGVSQSLWSLGGIMGTLLVGFFAAAHHTAAATLPIVFEILTFLAAIVMVMLTLKKSKAG
jgi:MFS transporter, DHA1 family, tetracycline resistance protein